MDVPLVGKLTIRLFACTAIVLSAGCSPSGDTDLRHSADDQAAEQQALSSVPERRVIQPEGYKPTPSPLSPGIMVGNTLYLSGSTGGDPTTGQLVPGGFEAEMRQVMANMRTVLTAADMDLSNVVRVTTYLADMADYSRYNEIYREFFTVQPLPVRATVAVRELARGAVIEMMMIAAR